MCGIAGYLQSDRIIDPAVAERMAMQIQHRGPNDAGVWLDIDGGLALAHRRLSIIDLSPAGHQPMISPCGRYALIYNGEIYNHIDLRVELERKGGHFDWRGHSDTETLLAALRHWGIEEALKRLNGMFAFALWDRTEQVLHMARDRMGEKPLYYGRCGKSFLFGSELKALSTHPDWLAEVDREALTLYLRHSYIPTPWSIYRGIAKLPPAHFVTVGKAGREISLPRCYWDLGEITAQGSRNPRDNEQALTEELDHLLRDSIAQRMEADVPFGAFLSGGYDSSTVAALMQAQSMRPIKTFSIGIHEHGFDEAHCAKAVAAHLGTDHTELYVTPEHAMEVIPKLPTIWDEPFADSSHIPSYLVSRLSREQITVSLSGDGGDELFGGYSRYGLGYQIWSKLRVLPAAMRRSLTTFLSCIPARNLDSIMQHLPQKIRLLATGDRLLKLLEVLDIEDGEMFYHQLLSHCDHPEKIVLGGCQPLTLFTDRRRWPVLPGLREHMMYMDAMVYLPDDILTKVDRASMAVSLEARIPFLDHRVVEFASRVPTHMKIRDGQGKWLLRQVLYRYVPKELMDRPKHGFDIPIVHWLRGPLRDWAEALLDEKRLRAEGFFDPVPIRHLWREHLSGAHHRHRCLWNVLIFQAWREA